ncbi:hypothetical protein SUGI_0597040 [Cryptomeria japonica]|nr:hypothetical protein SUGI_0597040 [Cryptomeria japonica]
MMNSFIRSGVGFLGSAFALFMYGAPICTFRRVMLNKTSGEMSGLPYAVGLFNCLVYAWYGCPLISNGWDNALVLAINTIGLLLQCCFCTIYLLFALPKSKRRMGTMVVGVLMAFLSLVTVSMWGLNAQKKLVVGSTGMVASVILYGSPLSDIRTVVRTKSVECMSFYFSFFAFLGSVLWLVYGALSKDNLIMAPNFLGIPLASVQIIIYCMYKRKKRLRVAAEDGKVEVVTVIELESVEDKSLAMTKIPAFPSS